MRMAFSSTLLATKVQVEASSSPSHLYSIFWQFKIQGLIEIDFEIFKSRVPLQYTIGIFLPGIVFNFP